LEDRAHLNFKSLLQEYVQARHKTHPRYRVVTELGPDHMKLFTVEVSVRGNLLGRGQGRNKKEAEQNAAGDALNRISLEGTAEEIAALGAEAFPPVVPMEIAAAPKENGRDPESDDGVRPQAD
jgi:hypothetical protein